MRSRVNAQQVEKLETERERLRGERDRLRQEVAAVQGRLEGIEYALATARGEPTPTDLDAKDRLPRGAVKDHVLRLITENADRGLVAAELVDLAKAQGITLDRASISSLLSRLKSDGILDYDGSRYRPAKPTSPKQPSVNGAGQAMPGGSVHAKAD